MMGPKVEMVSTFKEVSWRRIGDTLEVFPGEELDFVVRGLGLNVATDWPAPFGKAVIAEWTTRSTNPMKMNAIRKLKEAIAELEEL